MAAEFESERPRLVFLPFRQLGNRKLLDRVHVFAAAKNTHGNLAGILGFTEDPDVVESHAISDPDLIERDDRIVIRKDAPMGFFPIPPLKGRGVAYITGPSGVGKSTWCREYIKLYHQIFPTDPVILISQIVDDPTFDEVLMKRGNPGGFVKQLPPTQLAEAGERIELSTVPSTLFIIDDAETLPKKELAAVSQLRDDIATMGRHHNISLLYTCHKITNYKDTRLILTEATSFTLFPHAAAPESIARLLAGNFGLSKKAVGELKHFGRWITLVKGYPQTIVSHRCAGRL